MIRPLGHNIRVVMRKMLSRVIKPVNVNLANGASELNLSQVQVEGKKPNLITREAPLSTFRAFLQNSYSFDHPTAITNLAWSEVQETASQITYTEAVTLPCFWQRECLYVFPITLTTGNTSGTLRRTFDFLRGAYLCRTQSPQAVDAAGLGISGFKRESRKRAKAGSSPSLAKTQRSELEAQLLLELAV